MIVWLGGRQEDCRDWCTVGVGGVRAGSSPAPTARIDEEPETTREKSICLAACSLISRNACKASRTPAAASCSHPSQIHFRRKIAPANTRLRHEQDARERGLRSRYLKRRGLVGGRSGSISFHNPLSTIDLPVFLIPLSALG